MVHGNTRFISSVEHHDILTKSTLDRLTTGGPRVIKCRVEQIRYYIRRKNNVFMIFSSGPDCIALSSIFGLATPLYARMKSIILIFNLIMYIEQKSIQIS